MQEEESQKLRYNFDLILYNDDMGLTVLRIQMHIYLTANTRINLLYIQVFVFYKVVVAI